MLNIINSIGFSFYSIPKQVTLHSIQFISFHFKPPNKKGINISFSSYYFLWKLPKVNWSIQVSSHNVGQPPFFFCEKVGQPHLNAQDCASTKFLQLKTKQLFVPADSSLSFTKNYEVFTLSDRSMINHKGYHNKHVS